MLSGWPSNLKQSQGHGYNGVYREQRVFIVKMLGSWSQRCGLKPHRDKQFHPAVEIMNCHFLLSLSFCEYPFRTHKQVRSENNGTQLDWMWNLDHELNIWSCSFSTTVHLLLTLCVRHLCIGHLHKELNLPAFQMGTFTLVRKNIVGFVCFWMSKYFLDVNLDTYECTEKCTFYILFYMHIQYIAILVVIC